MLESWIENSMYHFYLPNRTDALSRQAKYDYKFNLHINQSSYGDHQAESLRFYLVHFAWRNVMHSQKEEFYQKVSGFKRFHSYFIGLVIALERNIV